MSKIKEVQKGCTETYIVKFWYLDSSTGFWKQHSLELYCNSRSAHESVERYFLKNLAKRYANCKVISVTYA